MPVFRLCIAAATVAVGCAVLAAGAMATPPPANLAGPPDTQVPLPVPPDIHLPGPRTPLPARVPSPVRTAGPPAFRARAAADLVTSQAAITHNGVIKLHFTCTPGFAANLLVADVEAGVHRRSCPSRVITAKLKFGRIGTRAIRQMAHRQGRVHIFEPDGRMLTRKVTITRGHVRPESLRATAGQVGVSYWKPQSATFDCNPISGGVVGGGVNNTETRLSLAWRLPSPPSPIWAFHEVVIQEWSSVLQQQFFITPHDLNATEPELYGFYRIGPLGVLEWSQDNYNPFTGGGGAVFNPWTWGPSWLKGYDAYVRAWVRLFLFDPSVNQWLYQWRLASTILSPTDAPGWCWIP
jgi:hypothetical protein